MLAEQMHELRIGDRVTTPQQQVGRPGRYGEVVDVIRDPGHERCRVHWDDGGETFIYPGTALSVDAHAPDTDLLAE